MHKLHLLMSTIAVNTSQNIDLDYDLSSVGERIVAGLIDYGILFAYLIIFLISISFGKLGSTTTGILFFISFLPVCFYSLLSELFLQGQSVGKRVMKIKVISLNGGRASFGQYLIRWLFRLIDVWSFSGLVAVITIAVSNRKQRLGDLVAGTALVKTKSRTAFSQTLFTKVMDENYKVIYPEVSLLKDSDIQLIKEVLMNVQKNGNTLLALEAMRKIESILSIKSQHEPKIFLAIVLSDYNFVVS